MKKYDKLQEYSIDDLDYVIEDDARFSVETFNELVQNMSDDTHIYIETMSGDKYLKVIGARISSENDLIIEIE